MGFINPKVEGSNPSLGLFLLFFTALTEVTFAGALNRSDIFLSDLFRNLLRKLKNFHSLDFLLESLDKDLDGDWWQFIYCGKQTVARRGPTRSPLNISVCMTLPVHPDIFFARLCFPMPRLNFLVLYLSPCIHYTHIHLQWLKLTVM